MQTFFKTALIGLTAFGATSAWAAEFGPIVTPTELAAAAENPIILDIRSKGFEDGHIGGAVSAPYGLFRGPADNPGSVPDLATLETTFEGLGLEPSREIVIVSQGDSDTDFGAAARVYWTLKSSGFTQLSVLNGGALAWVNAGLPVSTDVIAPAPTELALTWNNAWTVTTDEVNQMVAGQTQSKLVDARPPAFFNGEKAHDAAARPGTLPGAQNTPYTGFFSVGATAINANIDASALKTNLNIQAGDAVVSFCNTGHWAATNWFAMSELAGLENVKLYPGSMVEYSKTNGKMDNQPGVFGNLINQLTGSN